MRVKNWRKTVGSQFLPRGIKMSRKALREDNPEKNACSGSRRGNRTQKQIRTRKTLRAKGTLISEPRFSTPLQDATFPTRERENGLFKEKPSAKAIFPCSRGENRISQGVENRGSLISVPLALREGVVTKGSFHCWSL